MSAGPLRRAVGILGLLALVPTAVMLTAGMITTEDAAVRAGATLAAALVLGRVAGWWLSFLAREFERAQAVERAQALAPGEPHRAAGGRPTGTQAAGGTHAGAPAPEPARAAHGRGP